MSNHPSPLAITPYLIVDGASAAIDFYARAFGAVERYRLAESNGRIAHAELELEGATIMLADEYPEHGYSGPKRLGGSSCSLSMYVANVDPWVERAVAAGTKLERPVENAFYGERVGRVVDPFGHHWSFHQTLEKLTPDAIKQRYTELMRQSQP